MHRSRRSGRQARIAAMIFLMNDAVLDVDMRRLTPPIEVARFRALSLPFVIRLGCELFAAEPQVQHQHPERACRLAALIVSKAPQVNAALFVPPRLGCEAAEVEHRLAEIDTLVMARLFTRQAGGAIGVQVADAEVWRRFAA